MGEPKITTHALNRDRKDGWFTPEINGKSVIGKHGGLAMFQSRKEAREYALELIRSNPTAVFKE